MGYAICNIDFGMEAPVLVFVILYLRKLRFFVGDLDFDPAPSTALYWRESYRLRGFPVFRGTDNRQSDLGSWGPSAAREGRPKWDITSLTSSCIPPIIILFLILSVLLRTGGGLSSKRESETEVKGRNEVSVSLSMSEVVEGRVVTNGAVTWVGTAWNTKLPSLGFLLNSTGFKSRLALSSLSTLALSLSQS